jgi:GDPmannose 4,6-dehydratase
MTRTALITGISGQDGRYLTDLLLDKGYNVHGIVACSSVYSSARTTLHFADLTDGSNFGEILDEVQPDEVYNLGAQSHVGLSFDLPIHTGDVTGLGVLRLLEAIRKHREKTGRDVRFYQASSSEMFGQSAESPQSERTPFHPRSPYACAKVYGYWQTINYREAYGMFACNGILFNHESPNRGKDFVTRKITRAAVRIKLGRQKELALGNIDAQRDWGYAGDYVEAMWRMLQHDQPDDYVIATGKTHSVRDFLDEAFGYLDLDWHDFVTTDSKFLRPSEVDTLCGNATKAREALGWEPKVDFPSLVRMMIDHDMEQARHELETETSDSEPVR